MAGFFHFYIFIKGVIVNLKILKLKNGENLLGDIGDETSNTLTIKNPLALVIAPQAVMSYEWLAMCDDNDRKIQLFRSDLLCSPLTPSDELSYKYKEMMGAESGLIIPQGRLKI